LRQNRLQTMFELEKAPWEMWSGREASEDSLRTLSATLADKVAKSSGRKDILRILLEFTEKFQEEMNEFIQHTRQVDSDSINIAITQLPFPANFYTWPTRDRKGIVIGIDSLSRLFEKDPKVVNKIILRVVQRMLFYSLNIRDLKAHEATRGCLFDFTKMLTDIQYSIDDTYVCKECESNILKDKDNLRVFDSLNEWLKNTRSPDK
jgi:hypothetical protein